MFVNAYKKNLWDKQFDEITKLLRKSLDATDKYARRIFEDEEQFYRIYADQFITNLKKQKQITIQFPSEKFYYQLTQKLKGLTELFFPERKIPPCINQLKIKHKRIERLLGLLLQGEKVVVNLKIMTEVIRLLMQEESKLNMQPDLFIFKCFMIGSSNDQTYSPSSPPLLIEKSAFPKETVLTIKIVHSYFVEEIAKVISANLPTLGAYKSLFNKTLQNKEVKEVKQTQGKHMGDDNESNSKTCFSYFGHAMQFDFFNSLVQPKSLNSYIRRFSIIQDTAICRGLILGALSELPKDIEPEFDNSDEQQTWEEEIEKIAQEFCSFFEGYFQQEEESPEVMSISRQIAALRRQKKQPISAILKRHWCK